MQISTDLISGVNSGMLSRDIIISCHSITATIDAILVAQTLCVAAESEGLGICYLGTTTYMAHKIIELLKLPKGVVPVTTVTLGWPAERPDQVDRLPLEAVVHKEIYTDYTDESYWKVL